MGFETVVDVNGLQPTTSSSTSAQAAPTTHNRDRLTLRPHRRMRTLTYRIQCTPADDETLASATGAGIRVRVSDPPECEAAKQSRAYPFSSDSWMPSVRRSDLLSSRAGPGPDSGSRG